MSIVNKSKPSTPQIRPVYLLLLAISAAYIFILYRDAVILKPTGHGRGELLLINITIAVPEILIWSIAILSSLKLKRYAEVIKKSKDGKAIRYLANALILLSAYIVLICTSYSVVALFRNHAGLRAMVLIENYLPLITAFASSVLLLISAVHFSRLVHRRPSTNLVAGCAGIFIVVVGVFTWKFAHINPRALVDDSIPRFVLPVHTLLFTYILPQVVLWALGIYACLCIANYSVFVKGAIYKKLFANLYRGVLIVFICIFCAQLFNLANFNLNKFSILLLLVYCLLVLGTVGFALIYKGSNDLSKLEKI